MATTGKAALTDTVATETIQANVIPELRPAVTSKDFLRQAVMGNSATASWGIWDDLGAASAPADDLTDISSTAMGDTESSVTVAEVGFRIDLSDLLRAIHPANLVSEASRMVVAAINEKWETDLAAMMDDFSNVTSASSTLAGTDLLAAMSALEQRDVPGPYVAYLDPKQTGELRQEIATTSSSYSVGRDADKVRPFGVDGFFGNYMGLDIWQTSLVVTTSGLVGGAVFQAGVALGYGELWGPTLESQRDASLRALEIVGTACYGLDEIIDTRGQTVKSAA